MFYTTKNAWVSFKGIYTPWCNLYWFERVKINWGYGWMIDVFWAENIWLYVVWSALQDAANYFYQKRFSVVNFECE